MKRTIITSLLALLCTLGWAGKKTVVWENPTALMGASSANFKITKVELTEEETVLHIHAVYVPHYWIRFAKESILRTDDDKQYAITHGRKTNEKETDLLLDSLFWMPESGEADIALHFQPLPLTTKVVDFLEGYDDGAFRFWNICDSKVKQEFVLPDDWKHVQYAKDEVLPAAKINEGIATVKVTLLGYKPEMKFSLSIGNFYPLGETERFDKEIAFADDGTVTAQVPVWLPRTVKIGVEGMAFCDCVLAPGQETSILMKVTNDHKPFLAFKGYLAKTNMDLVQEYYKHLSVDSEQEIYDAVNKCETAQQRLKYFTDRYQQRVKECKSSKYTTAAKDLLCMDAEEEFVEWTRGFASMYTAYQLHHGIIKWEQYEETHQRNEKLLNLTGEQQNYRPEYLNTPQAPCGKAFWLCPPNLIDKDAATANPYNNDLQQVRRLLENYDGTMDETRLATLTHADCKAVIQNYLTKQQRIAQELASQETVFYQKFDEVPADQILTTILNRYKGKAVLIDIWATWCGPCRAGHKAMDPLKEELRGENVQFVYITSPTSPLSTWQSMIGDISGDHYYLTKDQYNWILSHYESNGIPTYAIYDTQGQQTYKHIGYPNVGEVKRELEKAMK